MDRNQDAHRQRIIDWINATNGSAGAFDVTTKGVLHCVSIQYEPHILQKIKLTLDKFTYYSFFLSLLICVI